MAASRKIVKTTAGAKPVAAVERALRVLDVFRGAHSPLWLGEISAETGLFKSTTLRLLETLRSSGYVVRLADGRYRPGAAVLELATAYKATFQLEQLVQPILESLAERTGESATFYVRQGDKRQCMWRVESKQPVRDVLLPGQLLEIGDTSAGQVFREFDLGEAISSSNKKTMLRESSKVDDDQTASLCMPVFDANEFVGAMALSGPVGRFTRTKVRSLKKILVEAATDLSRLLGHKGDRRARRLNRTNTKK